MKVEADLGEVVKYIPENFTGADFSALVSEAYMIAVKERIQSMESEIAEFKIEQKIPTEDELLPETYLKLKYPGDKEKQDSEIQVVVK